MSRLKYEKSQLKAFADVAAKRMQFGGVKAAIRYIEQWRGRWVYMNYIYLEDNDKFSAELLEQYREKERKGYV